jgi:splicing factor 3B subunit 3
MCSSPDDVCYNQIQLEQMTGHLRSLTHVTFAGAVLAVYPYLDRYVLAAAGNTVWHNTAGINYFLSFILKS